jgi:hypothetical protein
MMMSHMLPYHIGRRHVSAVVCSLTTCAVIDMPVMSVLPLVQLTHVESMIKKCVY